MTPIRGAQCNGMLAAISFVSFKDLANLVVGFALLLLLVLLIKELGGSRR
jgi:hypothetical protein